jgi:hypothetical protein
VIEAIPFWIVVLRAEGGLVFVQAQVRTPRFLRAQQEEPSIWGSPTPTHQHDQTR